MNPLHRFPSSRRLCFSFHAIPVEGRLTSQLVCLDRSRSKLGYRLGQQSRRRRTRCEGEITMLQGLSSVELSILTHPLCRQPLFRIIPQHLSHQFHPLSPERRQVIPPILRRWADRWQDIIRQLRMTLPLASLLLPLTGHSASVGAPMMLNVLFN